VQDSSRELRLHQPALSLGKRIDERIKAVNRTKSSIRFKVEHTIGVIKRVFGFQKMSYRGLAKNLHRPEAIGSQ
jgi:IS5 family transposase